MKRIEVLAYEKALVYKKGKLMDCKGPGKHWVGFGTDTILYSTNEPIHDELTLAIIQDNIELIPELKIYEIKDDELGIETKNGLFTRILPRGKIAYWNGPVKYELKVANTMNYEVDESIPIKILRNPLVQLHLRTYAVEAFQKGILMVDGEYIKTLGPGVYTYWKSVKIATIRLMDTRIQTMEVNGQEILTKDKAGLRINFQVQYQVTEVEKAVLESNDYLKQLYISIQLMLREYVGSMTLDQLLANKEKVGEYIKGHSVALKKMYGVELLDGGIKDIILPGDVKEIMNQVLLAQKKAQANSIMRHEETAATRSLLNTAKLMEDNTMLLKLKEMEYIEKIADKVGEISVSGGSKIIDQLSDLFITSKN